MQYKVNAALVGLMLFCALSASNCQNVPAMSQAIPNLVGSLPHDLPGPPLTLLGGLSNATVLVENAGDILVQRISLPADVLPVAFVDANHAYAMLEGEPQVLWSYRLGTYDDSWQAEPVIDLRGQDALVCGDVAYNGKWLVWMETSVPSGYESSLVQEVHVKARDLELGVDIHIATGSYTASDGFFMPFDQLYVEGSLLLYRHSSLHHGWRDTAVVLFNLESLSTQIVAQAFGAEGDTILHCSMDNQLVAWDVQSAYQQRVGSLPALPRARYSIYTYQLGMETSEEDALGIVTQNRGYYAPYVHQGKLLVTSLQYVWFDEPGRERRYSNPEDRYKELGYETTIELIDPLNRTVQRVVYEHEQSAAILAHFADMDIPRSIYRDNAYVGKRFLSWESNVAEQQIVFDMRDAQYVALPLDGVGEPGNELYPRVRAVPGIDADYFLIDYYGLREAPEATRYILRLE